MNEKFKLFVFFNMLRSAAPGSEAGADGQAPVVGGARNPQQMAAQKRLQQTQAQVDEVCVLYLSY